MGLIKLLDGIANLGPNICRGAVGIYLEVMQGRREGSLEDLYLIVGGHLAGLAAQTAAIGYAISRYTDDPVKIGLGTALSATIPFVTKAFRKY